MSLSPDSAPLPEHEAAEASETLQWQVASARAAVVKHHARLVGQLDAQGAPLPPFCDGHKPD